MRLSIVTALSFLVSGCASSSFEKASTPDAGEGGIPVVEGGVPPGCDASKLPKEDPCVVTEDIGVFVSSSLGSAQGDGSRAKPFASIRAGIDAAKAAKKRVYVCAETYTEAITLAEETPVFGYFDCAQNWVVSTSAKRAFVTSPTSPAVTAKTIQKPTRVEAMEMIAPDLTAPSASSIALFAVSSPGLRLVAVRVHGGKAGAGADGSDGVQLTDSGSAKNGANAYGDITCNTQSFMCLGGPSTSGGTNQCMGKSITPQPGGPGGAPGHKTAEYDANISTYVWHLKSTVTNPGGSNGTGGTMGMAGSPGGDVGSFSADILYAPANGTVGTDGGPGGGGLGGSGYYTQEPNPASSYIGYQHWGIAGGAAGAGGCPGLAAGEGKGGGASIGVLAFDSPMSIEASTIESSTGGDGGKAGIPSIPTLPGSGGSGYWGAQPGGSGGLGGHAGVSGNGGGGPSFGIAHHGTGPSLTQTTTVVGDPGKGVPQRVIDIFDILASPGGKSGSSHAF